MSNTKLLFDLSYKFINGSSLLAVAKSIYNVGMNWLVRNLDVGDRNGPALTGQTAVP